MPNATPSEATLPAGTQTLVFHVGKQRIGGADAAASGWAQITRTEDDSASHNIVAFQLPRGVDPAAFAKALDESIDTPLGAEALGGAETPSSRSIVALDSGRVFIACLSRESSGSRHAALGEWHVVNVSARAPLAPAPTDVKIDVALNDFAYTTDEHWPAGAQLIQVRNTGRKEHLMLLARLHAGATIGDFIADNGAGRVADAPIGVSRIGPGHRAFLPTKLEAGHYVLYCLITDPETKKQHIELGMLKHVEVDPPAKR